MRTKRTIRASFSADPPVVDVSLPSSWADLSQKELAGVLRILSSDGYSGDYSTLFAIFCFLARLKIVRRSGDSFLCRIEAVARPGNKNRFVFLWLSPIVIAEHLESISFFFSPGGLPVRLDEWHGAKAVDARLHGVSFGQYLQLENLYQGFISSRDSRAVLSIAKILYPGIKPKYVDDVFTFGLLQWLVQVKTLFASTWPNFFRPAGGEVSAPSMLEIMNNEIRALTGGDVAKEEVVFEVECWRALTELDFKAKEAEEYKRISAKS